jgi:protein gp37
VKNTGIEWTDHTVNFWWGCTKVSPACANCYAESVAKVFGKRLFGAVPQWGAGKPRAERLEKARLEALALNRQADRKGIRYRVFVNSMSDWLDDEVPIEWLACLLETISLCPSLDFQLLTKRPENWAVRTLAACLHIAGYRDGQIISKGPTAPEMSGGDMVWEWGKEGKAPTNVWIGTTVENQEQAEKRIPHLLKIPAKVRFLSCEPLLGPVKMVKDPLRNTSGKIVLGPCTGLGFIVDSFPGGTSFVLGIHWVICGGESGPKARPMHPDWVRSLRDQCAQTEVPFFFKQWGEWAPCPIGDGPDLVTDAVFRKGPGHDGEVWRVGNDKAGRLLDGVEHSAFPA